MIRACEESDEQQDSKRSCIEPIEPVITKPEVEVDFESICKLGQTQKLKLLLRQQRSATQCTLKLGPLLQLAIQYEQPEIVDVLLSHGTDNNYFVFVEDLVTLVSMNKQFSYAFDEDDLNDRIQRLVDAGLTAEHLTHVLRHSAQNDVATRLLLRNGADINIVGRKGKTALWYFFRNSSCFGDNMSTYEIFRDHVEKMKLANMPLSDANVKLFKEIQKKYEADYQRKYGNRWVDRSLCCTDHTNMKNTKINRNTTLLDVLRKNENELACLVGNEEFKNIVLSDELYDFPQYGCLLKLQYRKGLLRKALLDAALISFQYIASQLLPDDCCLEILTMLSNTDLRNLIRAKFVELL